MTTPEHEITLPSSSGAGTSSPSSKAYDFEHCPSTGLDGFGSGGGSAAVEIADNSKMNFTIIHLR